MVVLQRIVDQLGVQFGGDSESSSLMGLKHPSENLGDLTVVFVLKTFFKFEDLIDILVELILILMLISGLFAGITQLKVLHALVEDLTELLVSHKLPSILNQLLHSSGVVEKDLDLGFLVHGGPQLGHSTPGELLDVLGGLSPLHGEHQSGKSRAGDLSY